MKEYVFDAAIKLYPKKPFIGFVSIILSNLLKYSFERKDITIVMPTASFIPVGDVLKHVSVIQFRLQDERTENEVIASVKSAMVVAYYAPTYKLTNSFGDIILSFGNPIEPNGVLSILKDIEETFEEELTDRYALN